MLHKTLFTVFMLISIGKIAYGNNFKDNKTHNIGVETTTHHNDSVVSSSETVTKLIEAKLGNLTHNPRDHVKNDNINLPTSTDSLNQTIIIPLKNERLHTNDMELDLTHKGREHYMNENILEDTKHIFDHTDLPEKLKDLDQFGALKNDGKTSVAKNGVTYESNESSAKLNNTQNILPVKVVEFGAVKNSVAKNGVTYESNESSAKLNNTQNILPVKVAVLAVESSSNKSEVVHQKNDSNMFSKEKIVQANLVLPLFGIVLSIPLVCVLFIVFYKRGAEWWQHRHYRRMDFLIDGMYNN